MIRTGLFLLLAACAAPKPAAKKPPEATTMEWRGQFCEVTEPRTRWIENAAGWEMLWKSIGAPPPAVDWDAYFAVAVFLGEKNTGGYGIALGEPSVDRAAGTWTVRFAETPPSGFAIQALTRPYLIKLYPKTAGARLKVVVEPAR